MALREANDKICLVDNAFAFYVPYESLNYIIIKILEVYVNFKTFWIHF